MYLPKRFLRDTVKFPCRVIVRDAKKEELRATIIMEAKNRKLKINEGIYPYNYEFRDDFFIENGFTGKPEIIEHEDLNA